MPPSYRFRIALFFIHFIWQIQQTFDLSFKKALEEIRLKQGSIYSKDLVQI